MTQEEVLAHVLANDCHIYDQRIKDDGIYYYVRRNGTKKMVVVYPIKKGNYTQAAVCHICETLGKIKIPDYAAEYLQVVEEAKKSAKTISEFPSQGMN